MTKSLKNGKIINRYLCILQRSQKIEPIKRNLHNTQNDMFEAIETKFNKMTVKIDFVLKF